jgi:hypothetical protein
MAAVVAASVAVASGAVVSFAATSGAAASTAAASGIADSGAADCGAVISSSFVVMGILSVDCRLMPAYACGQNKWLPEHSGKGRKRNAS